MVSAASSGGAAGGISMKIGIHVMPFHVTWIAN